MSKILFVHNQSQTKREKEVLSSLFPNDEIEFFDVSKINSSNIDVNSFFKIIFSSFLSEGEWTYFLSNNNKQNLLDCIYFLNYNYYYNSNVDTVGQLELEKLLVPYADYKWIEKLQVPIAEHCNLNCNRCYHFSNLKTDSVFYKIDKYSRDLSLLKEMGFVINEIRLLGGEPFLNDNIFEFIEVTKKEFPYSNIKIVTNGLLLLKKDSEFLERLSKLKITVSISLYPPVLKLIDKIEGILKSNNITYEIFRVGNIFNKILTKEKNINVIEISNRCEKCILIYNGSISRCAPSVFIDIFNNKFDSTFPKNSSRNITEFKTRKTLLKHLNEPVELCNFCTGDSDPIEFEWEASTSKVSEDDYIR